MPANLRKLMSEVPRPLEIAMRDARDERAPIGRRSVGAKEQARRMEPLLALAASGQVPLDEHMAQAVANYVEVRRGHRR